MNILNSSSSQALLPKRNNFPAQTRFGNGNSAPISVINAAPGDVYALNRLYKGYIEGAGKPFSEEQTMAYIQDLLKDPKSTLLLAYYAGRAIGFIHAVEEIGATSLQKELYIKDLYVEPKQRGLGAAKSLLKRIDEIADQDNYTKITLRTAITNPARKLYEGQGFQLDADNVRYEKRRSAN